MFLTNKINLKINQELRSFLQLHTWYMRHFLWRIVLRWVEKNELEKSKSKVFFNNILMLLDYWCFSVNLSKLFLYSFCVLKALLQWLFINYFWSSIEYIDIIWLNKASTREKICNTFIKCNYLYRSGSMNYQFNT